MVHRWSSIERSRQCRNHLIINTQRNFHNTGTKDKKWRHNLCVWGHSVNVCLVTSTEMSRPERSLFLNRSLENCYEENLTPSSVISLMYSWSCFFLFSFFLKISFKAFKVFFGFTYFVILNGYLLSWCRLSSWFRAKGLRERRGTADWGERRGASSQTLPCTHRTRAPNTLFYLPRQNKGVGGQHQRAWQRRGYIRESREALRLSLRYNRDISWHTTAKRSLWRNHMWSEQNASLFTIPTTWTT